MYDLKRYINVIIIIIKCRHPKVEFVIKYLIPTW